MYMMRVCDTHLPFKQYFFCTDRRLLILICDLRPVALLQVTFYFFFISYNARGIHTHILPESFIELALPLLCVVRPTIFDRMEHTIFCFFFFFVYSILGFLSIVRECARYALFGFWLLEIRRDNIYVMCIVFHVDAEEKM